MGRCLGQSERCLERKFEVVGVGGGSLAGGTLQGLPRTGKICAVLQAS